MREATRPEAAVDLVRSGVTRHVLDGPRWSRTSRGFYRPATTALATPTQRILEAAAAMPPGAVIGGWAAAYVLGADLLDGLDDHTMRPRPVTVMLPPRLHRAALPGVRYVQQARAVQETQTVAGLPVTSGPRTARDLACWAPTLTEAVVSLDAMLHDRVVTSGQLTDAFGDLRGQRGCYQARRALHLCRVGVRSTWESRLRMLWVLELRYPMPLVNRPIFVAGRFVGAPDLLDADAGLAMEYDGARWDSTRSPDRARDRWTLEPPQHWRGLAG